MKASKESQNYSMGAAAIFCARAALPNKPKKIIIGITEFFAIASIPDVGTEPTSASMRRGPLVSYWHRSRLAIGHDSSSNEQGNGCDYFKGEVARKSMRPAELLPPDLPRKLTISAKRSGASRLFTKVRKTVETSRNVIVAHFTRGCGHAMLPEECRMKRSSSYCGA